MSCILNSYRTNLFSVVMHMRPSLGNIDLLSTQKLCALAHGAPGSFSTRHCSGTHDEVFGTHHDVFVL